MATVLLADANGDSGIGEVILRAKMGSRNDLGELLRKHSPKVWAECF